jgi:hypothetical protein
MAQFSVQLRAIQHLTRDLIIEADSEADARAQAEARVELISWDTSEPEDIQIEAVNPMVSTEDQLRSLGAWQDHEGRWCAYDQPDQWSNETPSDFLERLREWKRHHPD